MKQRNRKLACLCITTALLATANTTTAVAHESKNQVENQNKESVLHTGVAVLTADALEKEAEGRRLLEEETQAPSEENREAAVAQVSSYINIRNQPGMDGEIIGKLYNNSVGEIIGEEDGWLKISSGTVEGYIKAEYALRGEEAAAKAEEVGTRYAKVEAVTLRLREEATTESTTVELLPMGEVLAVEEELSFEDALTPSDDNAELVSEETSESFDDNAEASAEDTEMPSGDHRETLSEETAAPSGGYAETSAEDTEMSSGDHGETLSAETVTSSGDHEETSAEDTATLTEDSEGNPAEDTEMSSDDTMETKGWVKVTTEGAEGYVSADYVDVYTVYPVAESREEEEARLMQEEEERRAAEEAARAASEAAAKASAAQSSSSGTSASAPASSGSSGQTQSNSAPASSSSGAASQKPASSGLGQQIANYALQFVGNPYVYGGTSLTNGADCSGFVMSVYQHFGISLPRTSSEQGQCGTNVGGIGNAQAGDLVAYSGHVGIYIGNGQIVHASSAKTGIKISNANYREILSVRRIV